MFHQIKKHLFSDFLEIEIAVYLRFVSWVEFSQVGFTPGTQLGEFFRASLKIMLNEAAGIIIALVKHLLIGKQIY